MQQQQQAESAFVSALLERFEADESEATRELLERVCAGDERRGDYLRAFNLLLNTRSDHARQRRDLAAIARLIADSALFTALAPALAEETARCQSPDPHSLTMELTRLIANICNENPHLVDNILAAAPQLLPQLCSLYSHAETTPVEADSLTAVLNFLHNIALKETVLRGEQVAPCLQALLQNLLTDSRFCPFISQKRFQGFVSSLFKFHANVPLVAFGVYTALIKAARSLNEEYKRLAEAFKGMAQEVFKGAQDASKGTAQRISNSSERAAILERAGLADKKLIAIMKLFEKAKSNIFAKFNAFSFNALLKIFVKIAIMRPVALLNQPIENKLLITIINELMISIQEYKEQIENANFIPRNPPLTHENSPTQHKQEEMQPEGQQGTELEDGEDGDVLPPVEQERMGFTPAQIERFKVEFRYFDEICDVTRHFSETYFKIIKSTVQTLAASFQMVARCEQGEGQAVAETIESRRFLIGILTVRLQRILCMMLKLFPQEELARGGYYREIVALLLRLLPAYYDFAVTAESTAILEELPNMEDVATESEGSAMRYIMETIDEQSVKTFIQGKLLEKINIFSTIYEAILKFVYHLIDDETVLRENMTGFVHVFIAELRKKHLNAITDSPTLTLKQIEALRLALRVATELFHSSVNPSAEEELKGKVKLYRYCRLLTEQGSQNGLFRLLGDILNNLQKHCIESTSDLTDTLPHRQEVAKTIFAKIIIQRAKTYVNCLTLAHLSRLDPDLPYDTQAETKYLLAAYEGYFAYLKVMNDFITHTCASDRFVLFKEEILGTAVSRSLEYGFYVREGSSERGQRTERELLRGLKERVDEATEAMAEWLFSHSHLRLHRLPLLTRKVLHFDKVALSIKLGDAALLHQEQFAHVEAFIHQLSTLINRSSLLLTNQKMDLTMKLPRVRFEDIDGQKWQVAHEVQRVANVITMLSETIKLLTSEQYLDDPRLHISPNYLYSVLRLITGIIDRLGIETLPAQADDLFHASLWLLQTYLHYDSHLKRLRQQREDERKRARRDVRKEELKERKRRLKGINGDRDEKVDSVLALEAESEGEEEGQGHKREKNGQQQQQQREEDARQGRQTRNRRRRRNRRKKKRSKPASREQSKTLIKSGSKANLLQQSQVRTEPKNHQKQGKKQKQGENTLQRTIREYLRCLIDFLGSRAVPLIKNQTLAYLLSFLSRHMHRSIVQAPPYLSFEIVLSEILPNLLRIRVRGSRIPGYHFSLCKLGLQLFDDSHIKVDYELAVKRYLFEQEAELPLAQFVKMLKDNFKEVTQSTANFVEIAVEGEAKRMPFVKANYEGLLAEKGKKCTVVLREGVDLHLLNTKPDPARRKASEQAKIIKVSDYCPEGELHAFIEQLITHSIRLLLSQLDRCIAADPPKYETAMEPFTIRSILQTLQYLVRESPSLGPFVAKFKCKRLLTAELASDALKNREMVTAFVLRGVAGLGSGSVEGLQELGYLSVLIRLFSPLVVNAISGLVFELCLDSTPLVQLSEGKKGHVAFGSVIRLKVADELGAIMFEPVQLEWLYRKLCLLNLVTVLTNIREMAKLFLENGFIAKLYTQFEAVKTALTQAWTTADHNLPLSHAPPPIPGNYITRLVTPFYLSPLGILQELNISFHYNKKLNKNAPKISISTVLNRDSINAQLIPTDALKRYRFKLDWPFHIRRDNLLEAAQPEDPEEYYGNEEVSSQSDALSEEDDSQDSENSSYLRFEDMDLPMPDDDDLESYVSLDEPHQQLLNEEWDYSDDGDRPEDPEYPSGDDHVLELDDGMDLEGVMEMEMEEDGEDGEDAEGEHEEQDIDEYLQQEGEGESHSQMNSSSLINELNALPSDHSLLSYSHSPSQPFREFALNTVNEEDYYISVNALLNFEKVESIARISKAEKRQVHLLRFFLQLAVLPARKNYNALHPRTKTPHENKEESQAEENLNLHPAFARDEHIRLAEYVEYNQIYRYDHYHKETPKLAEEVERHFADQVDLPRRHAGARRNAIVARDNLIEIMPGWNITEVVHEPHDSDTPQEDGEGEPHDDGEGGSHIEIESYSEEEDGIGSESLPPEPMQAEVSEAQHLANITEILQAANIAMTAREFMRLDRETQQDILINIAEHQDLNDDPGIHTPRNSPVSFVEPADQDAVEIPNLDIRSRDPSDPLSQGRVIEALSDRSSPSQPEGPQPQLQQMQGEGQVGVQEGAGQVDEVYRKMSLQHSKKVGKDVMEALNKDGKNNAKFHELSFSELEHLLAVFFLTTDQEHAKYPYPLVETLCINTNSLRRIAAALLALLHLTPQRYRPENTQHHPVIRVAACPSAQEQKIDYTVRVYPSLAMKALHLLTHLTKNYSIAMALLRPNHELPPSLLPFARPQQSLLSSFEMLILLLRDPSVAHSSPILGFLITVLDNITMHHFYKNVHEIVERTEEEEQRVRISQDSVFLLGELLQSDFVRENLPLVSKIIMRLSVEEQNLKNFIEYLEKLVRQLTDQALTEVKNAIQQPQPQDPTTPPPPLKIVNIMSIFYEMVKAFQTFPTSLDRHDEVMLALRRIVEYEKLQQLCSLAVRGVFETAPGNSRAGEVIDCFFVLYEIATITAGNGHPRPRPRPEKDDEHNHIAELGELDLAEQLRGGTGGEELMLGSFNLSALWREAVSQGNFKQYVNGNIRKKMAESARRGSPFELPIIKIAAATPHLLSFDNKYALFKGELKRLRGRAKYEPIHISLRREDVFESSFEQLMTRSGEKLRGKMKIEFQEEEGEDAGGITREWFQLLSREMFNPNYGLFRSGSAGHTYHPSPTSYFNERHLDYFKFIGRIAGKALYDGYLLDAYFTPAFYKHILAQPITYRDMEQEDYEYFKSLTWMLENAPIEDFLELTFTYDCDNFGEIQTKELVPHGADLPVNEENKLQYVQLIAYAKMATSIKLQLEAFLTGLHELVPHRLLRIFSEKELEIMISGRPTIDIEDLRRNTELVNYMRNDPIIVWLFEVLENFDMELRTAFIQFVTGSSRVPVEGFKDLRGMNGVQRFNIHREFQEERLPRAHTCFNQLDLPNYKTKEILIEKLMYAITEGKEGFGMI